MRTQQICVKSVLRTQQLYAKLNKNVSFLPFKLNKNVIFQSFSIKTNTYRVTSERSDEDYSSLYTRLEVRLSLGYHLPHDAPVILD